MCCETSRTHYETGALMNFIVLYTTPQLSALAAPMVFHCKAKTSAEAYEQCIAQVPEASPVWAYQGHNVDDAYEAYYDLEE